MFFNKEIDGLIWVGKIGMIHAELASGNTACIKFIPVAKFDSISGFEVEIKGVDKETFIFGDYFESTKINPNFVFKLGTWEEDKPSPEDVKGYIETITDYIELALNVE
jgi:hypothetical protein